LLSIPVLVELVHIPLHLRFFLRQSLKPGVACAIALVFTGVWIVFALYFSTIRFGYSWSSNTSAVALSLTHFGTSMLIAFLYFVYFIIAICAMVKKPKPLTQKEWDEGEGVVDSIGTCGPSTTGDHRP
jgi:hypothetical protein